MRMWTYSARVYSANRQYITAYDQTISASAYADPDARAFAEQIARERVRHAEGVYPDMPIEGAWREIVIGEE